MALGGFPTGSMTPNDTHMVEGIRVWRGLICSVSDYGEVEVGERQRDEGTEGKHFEQKANNCRRTAAPRWCT